MANDDDDDFISQFCKITHGMLISLQNMLHNRTASPEQECRLLMKACPSLDQECILLHSHSQCTTRSAQV